MYYAGDFQPVTNTGRGSAIHLNRSIRLQPVLEEQVARPLQATGGTSYQPIFLTIAVYSQGVHDKAYQ